MIRHRGAFALPFFILAAALPVVPSALRAQEVRDRLASRIVVTATRYPIAPDSVASTVTVLRGDDPRGKGSASSATPCGRCRAPTWSRAGLRRRHLALRARGESDYVKVLVDRVPVNQPGGFYDFASLRPTTSSGSRCCGDRGRALRIGRDRRRDPDRHPPGRPRVQVAASGEGAASAARAGKRRRWGVRPRWSASLSRLTSDGTYDFNNDYRNTVASGRFGVRPGERTTVSLTGTTTTRSITSPRISPYARGPESIHHRSDLRLRPRPRPALSEAVESRLLLAGATS